jgi:hypothetical protein
VRRISGNIECISVEIFVNIPSIKNIPQRRGGARNFYLWGGGELSPSALEFSEIKVVRLSIFKKF